MHSARTLPLNASTNELSVGLFAKSVDFTHIAGQSVVFTLIDPSETDAGSASRTLTIASVPHEPDAMIVTRIRDTVLRARTQGVAAQSAMVCNLGVGRAMTLH